MNKKIIRLENNKEYFQISELEENNIKYLLLINVDNETDVKIVKKENDYIIEIESLDELNNLKNRFREIIDEEKKIYV